MRSPIKIHGGKFYLAPWIISHFPENYEQLSYYEGFCGGANVLFQKKPSAFEFISDVHPGLYAMYHHLKNNFKQFYCLVKDLPYERQTFEYFKKFKTKKSLNLAVKTFVLHRMSRGGMCEDFAWSDRERGGLPGDVNAWNNSLLNLTKVSERLQRVNLAKQDFRKTIEDLEDNYAQNLIYLDPSYYSETRTSKKVYWYEMIDKDHIIMLEMLQNVKAKVVLSGYRHLVYDNALKNWNRYDKLVPNHSGQNETKNKRMESIWTNY